MSNRIEVESKVTVYEKDGVEVRAPVGEAKEQLHVRAHWNRDSMVVLEIAGKQYTVVASDLRAAIQNATNAR